MKVSALTDHQLLIAIAEVNAEYEAGQDVEDRSQALNAEGERRWGDTEMSELADLVTRCGMTSDEFVAWAREDGQAWLDATR